jgi:hypothetical protein
LPTAPKRRKPAPEGAGFLGSSFAGGFGAVSHGRGVALVVRLVARGSEQCLVQGISHAGYC